MKAGGYGGRQGGGRAGICGLRRRWTTPSPERQPFEGFGGRLARALVIGARALVCVLVGLLGHGCVALERRGHNGTGGRCGIQREKVLTGYRNSDLLLNPQKSRGQSYNPIRPTCTGRGVPYATPGAVSWLWQNTHLGNRCSVNIGRHCYCASKLSGSRPVVLSYFAVLNHVLTIITHQ